MDLTDKVKHTVLQKGNVIRSPSGSNEWVVVGHGDDGKVILACISKYMSKTDKDLYGWFKIK